MWHQEPSVYYRHSDGSDWAQYIRTKLKDNHIDCKLNEITEDKVLNPLSRSVNVFVVTPDFLEHRDWSFIAQHEQETSIVILTGVEHVDFETAARLNRAEQALTWEVFENTGTEQAVRNMFVVIIAMFEHAAPPKPHTMAMKHSRSDPSSFGYANHSKIKHQSGQLYVLLDVD